MKDKTSNFLIVFILLIIVFLGTMYYSKIIKNSDSSLNNLINLSEEVQGKVDTSNSNIDDEQDEEGSTRKPIILDSDSSNMYGQNGYVYKYNNRYYYNGLNEYSKIIYDVIEKNINNIKKGNYVVNIDKDFNALLNTEGGQEELKAFYNDAVNALNLDIPDLFYIDFEKMYLTIESTSTVFSTTYKLYIDSGKNPNYFADEFISKEQVDIAISQIEVAKSQVKAGLHGTQYAKARALHDWMINYMDYSLSGGQRATVYGALIEKRGVCEAYARTYKLLLDELGIENVLVTGVGTNSRGVSEDHMWNYVKLDGIWYAVDVTWDDPIVIGGGNITDETKHKYFLVGSSEFFKNHTEKLTISPSERVFPPPKLSIKNYNG